MKLEMPVHIKEPEFTRTGNESRHSEPGGTHRDDVNRGSPPEHLLLPVVMTFEGVMPRLTVVEAGIVVEGDKVGEAFRRLIEESREHLASSENPRAELLRYRPATWFRFVAPDKVQDRPPRAGFWPEGEDVDDFIAAATEGRYEEEDEPDA